MCVCVCVCACVCACVCVCVCVCMYVMLLCIYIYHIYLVKRCSVNYLNPNNASRASLKLLSLGFNLNSCMYSAKPFLHMGMQNKYHII